MKEKLEALDNEQKELIKLKNISLMNNFLVDSDLKNILILIENIKTLE